ncbi:PD-(D/E)XK nuclease family protein [Candidatus Poribacteria bacterium]|nr:PD-(D/E)XK nuclease family protein [Candidatus Poribacteria bacterium]
MSGARGVQFVIGPAGGGKTYWCIEQVRQAALEEPGGPPLILLVPEQASYLTERAVLSSPLTGTARARVFSFARLAQWIHSQSPHSFRPRLSDIHRRVLVTAILCRMRMSGEGGPLSAISGIDGSAAAFLAELKQCRVSPGALCAAAASAGGEDPELAAKLETLARVAGEYDARIKDRFEDPEDSLASLRDSIAQCAELQGARVYVDGFFGFTPVEFEVLRGLVRRCFSTAFTLTISSERFDAIRAGEAPDELSRFYPSEETLTRLLGLALDEGFDIGQAVSLPAANQPVRFQSAAIAHLEKHFLSEVRFARFMGSAPEVDLQPAADPRDEARRAVEQLLAWREQHRWNWGEMAIMTRRLDDSAAVLEEHLRAARIPCFLDRHVPLDTHPLIQGLRAAIEAVLEGWRSEAILEFAKSGLPRMDRDAVARLEEFAQAYPRSREQWIGGKPWQQPPARSPFEDEGRPGSSHNIAELDDTRVRVAAPLLQLRDGFERARREGGFVLREFVAAICSFLRACQPDPPGEDAPVWARLGGMMQAIIEAAGDEELPPDAALSLVREVLSELVLPRIPPSLNQVLIGECDRTRQPPLKGVVVIGLAEGQFPAPGSNRTLLSDGEREELERLAGKLELRPSSRRQFAREGFLAYVAVTRASHALALLYAVSDRSGEAAVPSPYWDEIARLLGREEEVARRRNILESEPGWERVLRPREVASLLCRRVFTTRERDCLPPAFDSSVPLAGWSGDHVSEFNRVLAWAANRNAARADSALVRQLIGGTLRTSVSGLEAFASCPFRYFMRELMRLEVPPSPKMSSADLGNLAHAALRNLAVLLIGDGSGFGDVPADRIPGMVEQAFSEPSARLGNAGLFQSRGEAIAARLVQEQTVDLVRFLGEAARALHLRPIRAESVFGKRGELDGVAIRVSAGGEPVEVVLRGQIDRIDLAEDPSGLVWLAVSDYKLSARKQDWAAACAGLNLQLPVYLLVLEWNADKLAPGRSAGLAGAVYSAITSRADEPRRLRGIVASPALDALLGDSANEIIPAESEPESKTPARGDVLGGAQFGRLLGECARLIESLASRIVSGDLAVRPAVLRKRTPCGFCEFGAACRLDYSMNEPRTVPALKQRDVIESWLGPPGGTP